MNKGTWKDLKALKFLKVTAEHYIKPDTALQTKLETYASPKAQSCFPLELS